MEKESTSSTASAGIVSVATGSVQHSSSHHRKRPPHITFRSSVRDPILVRSGDDAGALVPGEQVNSNAPLLLRTLGRPCHLKRLDVLRLEHQRQRAAVFKLVPLALLCSVRVEEQNGEGDERRAFSRLYTLALNVKKLIERCHHTHLLHNHTHTLTLGVHNLTHTFTLGVGDERDSQRLADRHFDHGGKELERDQSENMHLHRPGMRGVGLLCATGHSATGFCIKPLRAQAYTCICIVATLNLINDTPPPQTFQFNNFQYGTFSTTQPPMTLQFNKSSTRHIYSPCTP